ncbi:S-methyl thiohydantoin desulfurase domain-containing protein, partial [Clavibacter michiganensis]
PPHPTRPRSHHRTPPPSRPGGRRAAAQTPALLLGSGRGEPITTATLRFGQRVRVVSAPAAERWHSPGGIELAGPRYFGYDIDRARSPGDAFPRSGRAGTPVLP